MKSGTGFAWLGVLERGWVMLQVVGLQDGDGSLIGSKTIKVAATARVAEQLKETCADDQQWAWTHLLADGSGK